MILPAGKRTDVRPTPHHSGRVVELIARDIRLAEAAYREAMRDRLHDYDADPTTGLCGHCAAGEVFWVHAGSPA